MVPQYALCLRYSMPGSPVCTLSNCTIFGREGEKLNMKAEELTIGDIIEVKFGDRLPADIRVVEARGFKVCTYVQLS